MCKIISDNNRTPRLSHKENPFAFLFCLTYIVIPREVMRFRDGALADGQFYVTMKLKYNQTYTTQEVKWQIITTFRVTARNKTKAKPLC